ncbi:bifunctional adenosylcobinamide kinase/adenosylcobinamide-phosphate guanylyltransferase [Nonomuraea indica]|uniref:bifunctional adenosylcobinamide kinase/adenosylcobinamide-phosphate guanylyltransferase n=1 Tax=Nonomuraea indica TaxID=1581193 RepID=UPI000C7CE513|nr:bifunctional adenosylcobinamide kinase/adenosylcobinamide-phosphate guanylyltransferase [Nonomuraea indica]
MKVLLRGTAGGEGWPLPGCRCASCSVLPAGHRRPFEPVVDEAVRFPFDAPPGGYRPFAGGHGLAGPDGSRLLYVPGGPLPDLATAGTVRCDLVLVDLLGGPERLGLLRRDGVVDGGTEVVAVGLDHRIRSEGELARRLALWGARAVPDGTTLDTLAPVATPPVPAGRRELLLGGSRSGKSAEAELRLAGEPYVTYLATGPRGEGDGEWAARVRAHRERRPAHWATVETTDLAGAVRGATSPLLVDGLGTWLAAVFDEHGAWEGDRSAVWRRCDELVAAWRETDWRIVAVSDEVGMGVVPATSSGRAFRDALGRLNERLAAESEDVTLVVAGRPHRL